MNNNFQFLVLLFVLLSVNLSVGQASEKLPSPFVILPQPHEIVLLKGSDLQQGKLKHIVLKGDFKRPIMGDILSLLTVEKSAGNGTLILILDKSMNSIPSDEGYIMVISVEKVEITAKAEAGLFYGCQTLEQLLEDSRDYNKPVPACKITDFPALSFRAVHFDVKHHLDHMNYYYESIDRLARYKINAVVFEFEDKLRYRRQPLVGAPQSISIEEMAALTLYAR
jgi:hexosaminidase